MYLHKLLLNIHSIYTKKLHSEIPLFSFYGIWTNIFPYRYFCPPKNLYFNRIERKSGSVTIVFLYRYRRTSAYQRIVSLRSLTNKIQSHFQFFQLSLRLQHPLQQTLLQMFFLIQSSLQFQEFFIVGRQCRIHQLKL